MSGDPTNATTVTGITGVYSATNEPGNGYAGACWNADSIFWRFGSGGDDLWKYDPAMLQWAHVKGALGTTGPIYGTMGIGAPGNTPGAATFGHPHWRIADQLWLYGNNSSTDMWYFDIPTGNWVWVGGGMGAGLANYGTQGVPSTTNTPGVINEVDCKWLDSNGNPWLFNDIDGVLWQFDVSLNQWIWKKGTPSSFTPIYGTIGTYAAANEPAIVVSCPSTGNSWCYWQIGDTFWVYINRSFTQTEIWKYSVALNQWACVRIDTVNSGPVYGTSCSENAANMPEPKEETRARWTDQCGNLWLFGGMDYCGGSGYNDLWRFNVQTNNWTWIGGGSIPGNLGVQGVPAITNWPNPANGAFSWQNENGFWLSAGQVVSNPTHIMWLYEPDTVVANFAYALDTACVVPGLVDFTDLSSTGCNNIRAHHWNFGDPGSGSLNVDTVQNPSHIYSQPGSYTITLIVENCTHDADTIQQTIYIPPCSVSISLENDTICLGECIDLTATLDGGQGPFSIYWDNNIVDTTLGPITVCPTITTTYNVHVTDSLGHTDSASATVLVMPNPSVYLGNDTVLCTGNLVLDAQNNGAAYSWNNGSMSQSIVVDSSGLYWVQVALGICSDHDSINVSILSDQFNFLDTILCQNDSLFLQVPDSTIWDNGSTGSILIQNTGTYVATYSDSNCTVTDSIQVLFYAPSADFIGFDTIGCQPLNVIFTDASYTPYGSILSWNWNFGDGQFSSLQNPSNNYNTAGQYSVSLEIETNHGCLDSITKPLYIQVNPEPSAIFTLEPEHSIKVDETIQFSDLSIGATSWLWDFGDGHTSTDQNPTHSYSSYGTYIVTLTVQNQFGCSGTISYELHLNPDVQLYVPNAFTPNGDGVNDLFYPVGEGIEEIELQVFDRWGELIYISSSINESWDGTYKGIPAKSDVYVWKIKVKDANNKVRVLTGHINLIR